MAQLLFYGVDPGKTTGVASCNFDLAKLQKARSFSNLRTMIDIPNVVVTDVVKSMTLMDVIKNAVAFFYQVTEESSMTESMYMINIENFTSRNNQIRGETMEYSRAFVYALMGLHFARTNTFPEAGKLRLWDPSVKSHRSIRKLGRDFMVAERGSSRKITVHEIDAVMMLGQGLVNVLKYAREKDRD